MERVDEVQSGVVAAAVPATLAGLAVLHGAWALGWRWPGGDDEAFAERVIGYGAGVPPAPATWTVAALLGGAAGVVRAAARPDAPPKARAAATAVGVVLLLRGALSIPVDVARGFDEVYERLDLALYSPLCLALGVGTLGVVGKASTRRLPETAHSEQPWRIHEIAPDFSVEDVWAFRTPGAGPDDFAAVLDAIVAANEQEAAPLLVRFLFAVRWKLGALFGWDDDEAGVGARVPSLRERLPDDLREAPAGRDDPTIPFTPVYELPTEAAQELANETVHDILHLGWVPGDGGDYELRMAALVKPNGAFGRLYMAAIRPFRYLIIYPALTRRWERAWRDHGVPRQPASTARTPA